jgi:hypothetical protein
MGQRLKFCGDWGVPVISRLPFFLLSRFYNCFHKHILFQIKRQRLSAALMQRNSQNF